MSVFDMRINIYQREEEIVKNALNKLIEERLYRSKEKSLKDRFTKLYCHRVLIQREWKFFFGSRDFNGDGVLVLDAVNLGSYSDADLTVLAAGIALTSMKTTFPK